MAEHTPTPWQLTEEDTFNMGCRAIVADFAETPICHVENWADDETAGAEAKANAKFIVQACNCHGDLVQAMEQLLDDISMFFDHPTNAPEDNTAGRFDYAYEVLAKVKEARDG
jgi:hypothetical protein